MISFLDKSAVKYLIFGAFQFVLDFMLFVLLQKIGVAVVVANVASRLSAATAGYYLNKKYTFSIGEVQTYAMMRRYWLFWLFMTGLSSLLILAWDHFLNGTLPTGAGKFAIECVLCVFGYLVSKIWVYKHDQE